MISSPWRIDFPFLKSTNYCYLDSAATSLKPQSVIDTVNYFYCETTANVARGEHLLTERVTSLIEQSRQRLAQFINAHASELVFTYNCTDSLNLLAASLLDNPQTEVIVSQENHHAALLPFMQRARLRFIKQIKGDCDLDHYESHFNPLTRLLVIPLIANATGNVFPVKTLCRLAKERGILTIVDAAQALGHSLVDVVDLDCDFLCFSAHKMLGPSGVGCLYGRQELLRQLKPLRLGGGIVNQVSKESFQLKEAPYCFEAGTPNLEGILGLGAAVKYLQEHDFKAIVNHIEALENYARQQLAALESVITTFDYSRTHAAIFNFYINNQGLSIKQLAALLAERYGVIINLGQQCCQPLYQRQKIKEAIRASFYLYNEQQDVERLVAALKELLG